MNFKIDVRNTIEEIRKNLNIDSSLFHEFSIFRYEKIIRKIFFKFADTEKYKAISICMIYNKLHKRLKTVFEFNSYDFEKYIQNVKNVLPCKKDEYVYFIVTGAFGDEYMWVYEGTCEAVVKIIEDDFGFYDYLIVDKKMEWLYYYCDDGECGCLINEG